MTCNLDVHMVILRLSVHFVLQEVIDLYLRNDSAVYLIPANTQCYYNVAYKLW